jgi:hypothetical protein
LKRKNCLGYNPQLQIQISYDICKATFVKMHILIGIRDTFKTNNELVEVVRVLSP